MFFIRCIKLLSSSILMLSFFLPLTQCSNIAGEKSPVTTVTSKSAASSYDWPSLGSAVLLVLFAWPLAGQVLAQKIKFNFRIAYMALITETLLSMCSVFSILFLVFWGGTALYGAYTAMGAISIYLVAAIAAGYTQFYKLTTGS